MTTESNKNILGPNAIIQLHKNELGTGKVPNAEVIAMANVIRKLEEATANLPSKKVNEVVDQLKNFMETLALSDCEVFARDVRRMMDNLIEVRYSKGDRTTDDYSDIVRELPNNHPWLKSSDADSFQSVNAMKEILTTLRTVNKIEESNTTNVISSSSYNTVDKRLTRLEEKIEKLLLMIDKNFISDINTLLDNKGE